MVVALKESNLHHVALTMVLNKIHKKDKKKVAIGGEYSHK
jgi:hypothetical protein